MKRVPHHSPHDIAPLQFLSGQMVSRVTDARRSEGNALSLLRDGSENYPAWLAAIAGAQSSIHLECYFIEQDETGRAFADAFRAAARRGVKVRVIYDWLGCRTRTSGRFWAELGADGVEVRCYNPPRWNSPLGWISRDHRKMLSVDRRTAFAGGLCIGDAWVGDAERGRPPWRDTAVRITGPAVAHLEAAFADSWGATGASMPVEESHSKPGAGGGATAWVVQGKPGNLGMYRLEQLVAECARSSLWLADAYFVATTSYVQALRSAALNGVDVRLLVPGASDFPVVQALSRIGYRPLLDAGVRVFEWNGPMMHAKTAVADGCWSRIGSSNSNVSSWIANRELDLLIDDEAFARQMEASYQRDLDNATEIVLSDGRSSRPSGRRKVTRTAKAGRMIAGSVGFASAVGATLSQRRDIAPTENMILAAAGGLMLVLAVIAGMWPGLLAFPLALLIAWIGMTLVIRSFGMRRAKRTRHE